MQFQICDVGEPWTFRQSFDYIHGRMVGFCFKEPPVKEAFAALEPGGYLEFQDILFRFDGAERSLEGTAVKQWAEMLHEAAWFAKKDWMCPAKYKEYMENAGFVDVKEILLKWPINGRSSNRQERVVGAWSQQNLLMGLESFSMAPMTRYLGMSKEEVHDLLEVVKKEIENPEIQASIPV